ncbi:hypothetical protein Tco_1241074 [Tanacetum coccineum]
MPMIRQGMSFAKIEQIGTQRIANAIEAIAFYEAKICMAHDSMDQEPGVPTMSVERPRHYKSECPKLNRVNRIWKVKTHRNFNVIKDNADTYGEIFLACLVKPK